MKKSILLCGLLLAVTASLASAAAGTNLRWNLCFGDGGVQNKVFTCTTNAGSQLPLVGSFEMPQDLTGVTGVELVVDVAIAGSSVPAWWQFKNAGACRAASLTMNGTGTGTACPDWAGGAAAGGLAAYSLGQAPPNGAGLNTARILGGLAVAADAAADLTTGQEYFAFNIGINNAKTVGTGSCAGCSLGACIVFNSIKVATPPVSGQPSRDIIISGATNGTDSNYALWQGGAGVTSNRGAGCPAATPTHTSTWSKVKTLYR